MWNKPEDKLPDLETPVLVLGGYRDKETMTIMELVKNGSSYYYKEDDFIWQYCDREQDIQPFSIVTHWMPLPGLPPEIKES